MEYIDGQSLADVTAAGPLTEPQLLRLAAEVAGALGAAHRAGLVHRDIKPANILIDVDGGANVIDFGLAAAGRVGADDPAEVVAGTFDYSAPEQTGMLARPVDGRADLYALGVVLYECATGRLPFRSDDAGELIRMHATVPAPDPRVLRPDLSPQMAAVIGRLLAKDPDDRYADADRLAATLGAPTGPPADGLVGRDRELAELTERWRRALGGAGGFVLLEGAAGTGRRALAGALADTVAAGGALVLTGRCADDEPTPLAAVRAAVDRYAQAVAAEPDSGATADLLREAAGAGAPLLAPLSPALAGLLDVPAPETEVGHGQFINAVAAFLAGLGKAAGGLLLQVDDVHWLDRAGLQLLRRLAGEMAGAPLLVVATAGETGTDEFREACGARLDLIQRLGPMTDADAAQLVIGYLAGAEATPELIAEVTARGCGNPFTILEYLRALVDAGALHPRWGAWVLDTDLLHAIHLPEDVLDLVLARVDAMGDAERRLLTTAAVIGSRFSLDLLADVTGHNPAAELAAAADRGLVGPAAGRFRFTHERIREALLRPVGADELRTAHQRIAEALHARNPDRPADIYAMARHYAHGETARSPERVFQTGAAAGLLALDEHAPETALEFLRPALDAAAAAGIVPDGRFHEALGRAYLGSGQPDPAVEAFEVALAGPADRVDRARRLLRLAIAQRFGWNVDAATETAWRGLAEIGHALPRTPGKVSLWTAAHLLRWIALGNPAGKRRHRGGDRELQRIAVELTQHLAINAYMSLQPAWILPLTLHTAALAESLNPSDAYARGRVALASLAGTLHMRRRRDRHIREAHAAAAAVHDPATSAYVEYVSAIVESVICGGPRDELVRITEENRRWLEPDLYLNIIAIRCIDLAMRGYSAQAAALHRRALAADVESLTGEFETAGPVLDAVAGLPVDAGAYLAERCLPNTQPAARMMFALTALAAAVEQSDLGPTFERAIEEFLQVGASGPMLAPEHRHFFVRVAFGRLELARKATTERDQRIAEAEAAVRRLRRVASTPLLKANHRVARADLAVLAGRHRAALRLLARAEELVPSADSPVLEYEVARVRARALRGQGHREAAARQARVALALAGEYGWVYRARWIRAEFDVTEPVLARRTTGTATASVAGDRYRRRLEALQQVSLAAANVLQPEQLARVALDETLRILGAERAVLFLADEQGRPQPSVGRTTAGDDLTDLSGYSRTLVDRVAETREAIVVTGSEQGAALGSQSALIYGLRSIMVAPLELDDRLLGVVYLDSRAAKGMFTDSDVDILTAVNSHIAVSLETARAAQLEGAVLAARQQRDVAEQLRDAIGRLAGILDPDRVQQMLLDIVADVSPAERAFLVYQREDALTVVPAGAPVANAHAILSIASPTRDGNVAALAGTAASWIAVPLHTQTSGHGVLVAVSDEPGAFGDEHLQLIAAIAGHAAAAYENAELYRRVQQLATTDALTGVANRRHFTDHAADRIALARRDNQRLAAMMIDIDHFKKINDTYGHAVGDAVIRSVADTLRANVQDPDILCRYGGEEFAILTTDAGLDPVDVAERLREAIEQTGVDGPTGPVAVTVSIGVAELATDDGLDALLGRADAALYRAKEGGRDQVQPS